MWGFTYLFLHLTDGDIILRLGQTINKVSIEYHVLNMGTAGNGTESIERTGSARGEEEFMS